MHVGFGRLPVLYCGGMASITIYGILPRFPVEVFFGGFSVKMGVGPTGVSDTGRGRFGAN